MSQNHPHDNIYSILGKLEALKPTPEEQRFALVKEIQETVDAQGSILEGTNSAEQQLMEKYMGFKKLSEDSTQDVSDFMARGGQIQYGKPQKGPKKPGLSFASKHIGGGGDKMRPSRTGAAAKSQGTKVVGMEEDYDRVADVKNIAKEYMNSVGYTSVDQLEAEDIAAIGMDAQCNYADVCEILGCELPDSLGPVKSYDDSGDLEEKAPPGAKAERMVNGIKKSLSKDGHLSDKDNAIAYATTWKAHNQGKVEETTGVCEECGMTEGECEHTRMSEGEKETTKHGIRHHAKPGVYGGYNPETDPDKDNGNGSGSGREKKGRGRPKKADGDKSQASLPWGGQPPKDTYKHQKGSYVHKISESRMIDESGEALDHILNRFRHEVRNFEQGGDLDQDLYDALFDYYLESGEIPYGVAKARTGDPYEWVAQNLESHLRGGNIIGGNQEDDYSMEREAIGEPQPGIPGNIPVPGKMDRLNNPRDYYEEEVTMEDELNELAKLAGLTVGEGVDKAKFAALADPKDKITYADKIAGATQTDEEVADEGNEFGKKIRDAKADGIQPGEKIEIDGREVPVKECDVMDQSQDQVTMSMDDLLQLLQIAGLGNGEKAQSIMASPVEIDAEVDEEVHQPIDPVNNPKPEYKTMKQSTMNPGEGEFGEKAMHGDRPTFKNGDNPLTKPANEAVIKLEAKLAAEYDSIKKVSK